ncbi:MAG: AIR synthase related protein, partial [Promethearchaeota archaeon]
MKNRDRNDGEKDDAGKAKGDGIYDKLGVSYSKKEVHNAVKDIDAGIFPHAFCKILPDISGDPEYCSVFHSDGAGTKTILAYMMYKETNDLSYFKGVVQDSIVMNVDDVLAAGVDGGVMLSNTIGRNKKLISGEIIKTIISAHQEFTDKLTRLGFKISLCGGETADIGDLVRTLVLDSSLFARVKRTKIISMEKVGPGQVIIGLRSDGKASYEEKYNSGIGSNGLTLARHGSLSHVYYNKYKDCYDPNLDEKLVYFGKYELTDKLTGTPLTIGEALLSPTRTYAPIMVKILEAYRNKIFGIVHNTGGGQTKCLHFGRRIKYIKDNLFEVPPIFKAIKESSGADWEEMYRVFNMGHRFELIVDEEVAQDIINISEEF